jgi:hypothetical protein
MNPFALGDRFIAMHSDLSAPIYSSKSIPDAYGLPDGPLKENTIYHVENVRSSRDGNQGLFITDLRVFIEKYHIPCNSSRFRKVDFLSGHAANKRRRKEPVSKSPKIRKLVTA